MKSQKAPSAIYFDYGLICEGRVHEAYSAVGRGREARHLGLPRADQWPFEAEDGQRGNPSIPPSLD